MPDSKISLLPEATSINDSDICALVQSSTTKRSYWSLIKSYILGGRTIGGTGSSDVTTNGGIQTQTNKTLTAPNINSPVINNGATLNATSTDLDKMRDIPTTRTELGYVNGARSNLQAQIDGKVNIGTIADVTKMFIQSFAYSAATKEITESAILNGLGGFYVDRGVTVQLYKYMDTNKMELQSNPINVFQVTTFRQVHLQQIDINNLTSGDYLVVIIYKLNPISGV